MHLIKTVLSIKRLLNKEYRKFLSNQMKFREQENNYKLQAKVDSLNEMKLFSQYEKEKEEEERK